MVGRTVRSSSTLRAGIVTPRTSKTQPDVHRRIPAARVSKPVARYEPDPARYGPGGRRVAHWARCDAHRVVRRPRRITTHHVHDRRALYEEQGCKRPRPFSRASLSGVEARNRSAVSVRLRHEAVEADRPADIVTDRAPIRILFVMIEMGMGGSERLVFNLIRHLDRRRFEPSV